METAPNEKLLRFSAERLTAEWTSKQARRLYEAGLEGERDGSWTRHAPCGTVRMAPASRPDSAMSDYGTSPERATAIALTQIARLRAEADRIERRLATYGPSAFVQELEGINTPFAGADPEGFLVRVLSGNPTHVMVNGRLFSRDVTGSMVRSDD